MYENTGLIDDLEQEGFVVTDVESETYGTRYYIYKADSSDFTQNDLDDLYEIASSWETVEFVRTQAGLRSSAVIAVYGA